MAKVLSVSISTAIAARVNSARQQPLDELQKYITEDLGRSQADAERVSEVIDNHFPLSENSEGNRRMKASQFLQLEVNEKSFSNSSLPGKHLDELACRGDVDWARKYGRKDKNLAERYHNIRAYTGMLPSQATREDWHKMFFCDQIGNTKCTNPPLTHSHCSGSECQECKMDKGPWVPEDGKSASCHAHTYCVGEAGECCPNPKTGKNDPCCDLKPDWGYGDPIAEYGPSIPAQETEKTLHGGAFLGPLRETFCKTKVEVGTRKKVAKLHECAEPCEKNPQCKGFTFNSNVGECMYFSSCDPQPPKAETDLGTMVFVKNIDGMTPTKVPDRFVAGSNHHFFVIGDWGSESCPGKASMHYMFKGLPKDSPQYKTDHNAQKSIADNMGKRGDAVHPFMVVNAGDNFYWGGVFPRMLGGRGIHDKDSWRKGFEKVYHQTSLQIPWIGVLGNHDYGGDGCMADVRAQFDYTIKDMLLKNRWKMPSAYFTHLLKFDDFSAEYFMLDTNIEDAFVGRHGGICKQTICWQTKGRENVPYQVCKDWFVKMWAEQTTWFNQVLAASTADWKIVVMHHKPHGDVAKKIHPGVVEHGVQLMIGSHTHELAFFEKWKDAKKPLLVVGSGGGAQANPGCGGAMYCSRPHEYGFADVEITKKQMTVSLHMHNHQHQSKEVLVKNICKDGSVRDGNC